ncbi:MAG TPA: PorV/PorQ family protein [Bacteroidota bacterium]|nr:PorV/PorQ family protein [Bacteroidota bacterium]
MTTMLRSLLLATLALALVQPAVGQSKVGTTAAQFLGIGIGPRGNAMGGAFVALGNDATAMYWNPGGLSRLGQSQVMASHTDWLVETNLNWIGVSLALDADNAVGISLTQLDLGEDDVTTVSRPEGTGERWTAQDIAFTLTYARNLTDRFSIGGSFKYITQQIWNESASTIAFDVGLLFTTPFDGLRLGMSLTNFGGDLQLDGKDLTRRIDLDPENSGNNETIVANLKTDSWELPLFFRAGVSYDLAKSDMMSATISADAVRPNDNLEHVNIGGEFGFRDVFFVRLGWKGLFLDDSEEGFSAGAGLNYPIFGGTAASIDYTYQDFGIFDGVQTITLAIKF